MIYIGFIILVIKEFIKRLMFRQEVERICDNWNIDEERALNFLIRWGHNFPHKKLIKK